MIDCELSKPTHCPRCDYALRGLPETGICPECGDPYDRDFIILRGTPVTTGEEPNGQRGVSIWGDSTAGVGMLALVGLAGMPPILLLVFVLWALEELVRALVIWTAAVRKNTVLVWASPAGVGQQAMVDADSPAGAFLQFASTSVGVALLPAVVLLYCFLAAPRYQWVELIVFGGMMFVSYLIHLGRRTARTLPPSGIRPGLFPWASFTRIELQALGCGHYQLWARSSPRIRASDVIKVEFAASTAEVNQFADLLRQWAGSKTLIIVTPPDRSPGLRAARKAGVLVGRVFRGRQQCH